jgi:predicted RNase H-like HicB family nuclease
MKLKVVFEPSEAGGYTAYVPSLPGCIVQGENREEALANIKKAVKLFLEPTENDLTYITGTEVMEVDL